MKKIIILFIFLFISVAIPAQEKAAIEDYQRAVSFLPYNLFNKKVFNIHIEPQWFADSTGFWYIHQSAKEKKYLKIEFPGLNNAELFDHAKLAHLLTNTLNEDIKPDDLPVTNVSYKDSKELLFTVKNRQYKLNLESYTLTANQSKSKEDKKEKLSPDKDWIAYAKDYNLYIRSAKNDEVKQLSSDGKKGYEYAAPYGWGDIIIGEGGERPEQFYADWSEDGKWIYTNIYDLTTAQKMYLLDWSIDTLYRPVLLSYYRGSPGDTGMVYVEPAFFNVKTGKEVKPELPKSTHINSISVTWSETPGKVYLRRSSRGFKNLSLYTFDLQKEELQEIYSESSSTNIDNFDFQLAEESGVLFFLSEKDGWRQLYKLDLETNETSRVTNGEYYINDIEHIDQENKRIYFLASGKEKGRNPYYQHLYSLSFDGADLKLLTPENRHHDIDFSPDGKYLVDNFSTSNDKTVTVLRSASSGKVLKEIGTADISALKNWQPPQEFSAIAHDGKTEIYGALWKPTHFNPDKKYPIIDNSYTGPHTNVFPNSFRRTFYNQALAELGFIIIQVDGLGTAKRSKAFHNYSYKNLGGGLVDHIGAIQQLSEKFSWIDTTRVGIFGHSAGGYDAARGLLAFPEFYKVAVASSADHDHRMEKAWWPEMYMGWPVDSTYHLQSNITMAGNLKGKLLITHGGIDENVNPSATFKLAEALIKADKQFDMMILPSQRHGYQGDHGKYFTKLKWNYFVEHLLGLEPIWDFVWEEE
ncbi:MAG: DPP IV N-terminal domain-containing protein [Candidatus Cyclobacteriaceae bacterium M2_1C_046]